MDDQLFPSRVPAGLPQPWADVLHGFRGLRVYGCPSVPEVVLFPFHSRPSPKKGPCPRHRRRREATACAFTAQGAQGRPGRDLRKWGSLKVRLPRGCQDSGASLNDLYGGFPKFRVRFWGSQ